MTNMLVFFSILAISAGLAFFAAGTLGLLRLPDLFTRLHALTKADNLGLGLIVLGLLPWAPSLWHALELVLIWLLVLLGGATGAHLIAKRALHGDGEDRR
jgi:multicomponent Na+:H+ antiporter subunit G